MSVRPGAKPVQDRFQRRRLVNRVKAVNSLLIDLVDIEGAEIQRSHPHRSSKGRLLPLPLEIQTYSAGAVPAQEQPSEGYC
jgi:hypothetical protein